MNLIAGDDLIPYWGKIAEKSLFAQTQIPCHDKDLKERSVRRFDGWTDQRQIEKGCDSWETAHQFNQRWP
jgi:hypothetical protein